VGPGANLFDLERKKSLAPAGIRTPDHPASSKVTIPIILPWLPFLKHFPLSEDSSNGQFNLMKMMKFDINMISNLTEES